MEGGSSRKRRGRGEGSVYQRGDGRWVGAISLAGGGDRRRRKVVYGASKREVLDEIARLRGESRAGVLADAGRMTVGDLLARWQASAEGVLSPGTLEKRAGAIARQLRPILGGVRLAQLSAMHVEGFYSQMRRDRVGRSGQQTAAKCLVAALNYAVRLRLLPASPAAGIPLPAAPEPDVAFLTAEQARALLIVARGYSAGSLVETALDSGCRQGELLALAWGDLDLDAGLLHVRRSLSRTLDPDSGRYVFQLKEPKTKGSRRCVALRPASVQTLERHRADMVRVGHADAPVFCTASGGYRERHSVRVALRRMVARTNAQGCRPPIPLRLSFHALRHSCASLLLSEGASIRAVSLRLGHTNPAFTLARYAHCMPTDDAKLAAIMARLLD